MSNKNTTYPELFGIREKSCQLTPDFYMYVDFSYPKVHVQLAIVTNSFGTVTVWICLVNQSRFNYLRYRCGWHICSQYFSRQWCKFGSVAGKKMKTVLGRPFESMFVRRHNINKLGQRNPEGVFFVVSLNE